MKLEKTIAIIERTPREQRAQVAHDMAVASGPGADATAALRTLGLSAAADAFENLAWEASWERLTVAAHSAGVPARHPARV